MLIYSLISLLRHLRWFAHLSRLDVGSEVPPESLPLFEMVLNAVHKTAPSPAIAFNTHPEDTAEAAARQLAAGW
jgi:hypothetical protein